MFRAGYFFRSPVLRTLDLLRYVALWVRYLTRPRTPPLWQSLRARHAPAPAHRIRILFATDVGGHSAKVYNAIFALATQIRGAEPTLLLCDGMLPGCEAAQHADYPDVGEFAAYGPATRQCLGCFNSAADLYRGLPIPVRRFSEFITPGTIRKFERLVSTLTTRECFEYRINDIPVGEEARASLLRFMGKADLSTEPEDLVADLSRRYLCAALISAHITENLIDSLRPDRVVLHHGVYVPQGVVARVARSRGIPLIVWAATYRNSTVICSHDDTYHRTFLTEPVESWENVVMTPAMDRELDEYLGARRGHREPWSWSPKSRGPGAEEHARIREELNLDAAKPTFGLLTNVSWDAALYYQGVAFHDMFDWLFTTVEFFAARPDLQLIIRVHPHEGKPWNREPSAAKIRARFPILPENVRLVDYSDPYNTYSLMTLCRVVLLYGTKTGVELAPLGIPIVAASDAWIRNKGISYDPQTRGEYLDLLNNIDTIPPLTEERVLRARRYAYHYFFRRTIPLSTLVDDDGLQVTLKSWDPQRLAPGEDEGLDVVCDGILSGAAFTYLGSSPTNALTA